MATEKSVMAVIRAGRPTFRNQNDKMAFVVHASFLSSGYILTATGPQALNDTAFSNSSSNDEVSIDQWNELNDEYAFVYANPEKGLKKVVVKCVVMNENLIVDALAEGSSDPAHLVINVVEYAGDDGGANYSQQFKNLEKLVKCIDSDILTKLNGSTTKASSSSNRSLETSDRTRQGRYVPGAGFGSPASPSNFPSGIILPPVPGGSGSDLFPGPGAGMYPTRVDPGLGGSMLVGPNDPRWFGGTGGQPAFPAGMPGIVPGARFDPFGPPGVPGFEPNRFARNPRRPGNDPHPDLQHFRRDIDSDFI